MTIERQVSFAAGELDPELWSRTDLAQYLAGARTCLNFQVTEHGVLTNRTGTQLVRELGGYARLVPFIVSVDDIKLLIFESNQLYGASADSTDPRYVFDWEGLLIAHGFTTSPIAGYSKNNLERMRYAQASNDLTLVAQSKSPKYLTRDPDTDTWATGSIDFSGLEPLPNIQGVASLGQYPRMQLYDVFTPNETTILGDADHAAREWTWAVTWVVRDEDDNVSETRAYELTKSYVADSYRAGDDGDGNPSTQNIPPATAVYADTPLRFWVPWKKDEAAGPYTVLSTRIYRGREGHFGFVGEITGNFFEDDGAEPEYSTPPPRGENPFSNATTDSPATVTYFEGRRYFGGTKNNPSRVYGSAVASWLDHDEVDQALDDDSLFFDLASSTNEEIRALVEGPALAVLTVADGWVVVGDGEGGPITPNAILARPMRSRTGCGEIEPVVGRQAVFFAERNEVYPWVLSTADGGMKDMDASLASRHLFRGYTIKDMAVAHSPYTTLWVVRSDGALLSMTYLAEQQLMAWTRHEIAGDGKVLSVATLPEGTEDGVYLVVQRGSQYFLERLAYRQLPWRSIETTDSLGVPKTETIPDVRYAVHLDHSVSYNGAAAFTGTEVTLEDRNEDFAFVQRNAAVDMTTAASNATADDIDFFGATQAADTATYFAADTPFDNIYFLNPAGPGLSNDEVLIWEYYDGSGWTESAPTDDDTNGLTATGFALKVSFNTPPDWIPNANALDATARFRRRVRLVSGSFTTRPEYDQAWIERVGYLGETITATFDSFTGQDDKIIEIDNPTGGVPVRILLSNGAGSVYDAQVLVAPSDGVQAAVPSSMKDTAITTGIFVCTESIGGLSHLTGDTVSVLADGATFSEITGAPSLDMTQFSPYEGGVAIAHIGMPYTSDFESMDVVGERGRQKIVKETRVEVEATRGLKVGCSLDTADLVEVPDLRIADAFSPPQLQRADVDVNIPAEWETTGRVAVRQDQPLPCTLIGITRELIYGGR